MNKITELPPIGFGTWQLNGTEGQNAIEAAINCGYRLIDTAASYGNETTLKRALHSCGVLREKLLIQGKLWNTKRKYNDAITACKQSLKRLGIEYFDLYLIHWPASPALYPNWREMNAECWKAMEKIHHDGLARVIGVCNYLPHHIDELLETADICPSVNQIEMHPGFANAESLKYCREKNILVEAWSPLGEGNILQSKTLKEIAAKYGKTPAQICLRWCIQHEVIPLPRSSNPERISQNFDVCGFELSDEDMRIIDIMPFSGGAGFDPDTITIYG
jgi:diketogulonate reductase-like aldo/keto reductase